MKSDVRPFFFRLFSCCILVEGATRCGVFDVQRSQFILINRVQFELLSELNQYSVNDIKKNSDSRFKKKHNLKLFQQRKIKDNVLCNKPVNDVH